MTKQTYVKVNGVWKPCTSIWTKAGGVWKQDVMPLTRVGGVYKECMEYTPDPYAPINGNEFEWDGFTYKVIVKDYGDGVKLAWLDRNLGASRVATSYNDSQSYGDLYQWGRLTDGHEKRNSGNTSTLSSTDVPGHSNFILTDSSSPDWRVPQNDNLWQGTNGINNPCPPGWRLPTNTELDTERQSWSTNNRDGAYASLLKLPTTGFYRQDGSVRNAGWTANYWSSDVYGVMMGRSWNLRFTANISSISYDMRGVGHPVRCIRDI